MKKLISFAKAFASGIGERKLTTYATSGCYYLFMALVPTVMIFCCILPYTPFSEAMLLEYIRLYFAESLGEIVQSIVSAIYRSSGVTLTVSILLTLFSASASMKAIMRGMNAAYNCKKKENAILFNIRALVFMVLLIATLLLSLVIMVYGGKILSMIHSYLPHIKGFNGVLSGGRYLIVMAMLFVIFLAFYTFMPSERTLSLRKQIPGAIFASVIWVLFSSVFTFYINISNKYGAYGFIGTIMVMMMWMNYCMLFLLIGGYLNSFLGEQKRIVQ